jgi:hypothetical protein
MMNSTTTNEPLTNSKTNPPTAAMIPAANEDHVCAVSTKLTKRNKTQPLS